MIFVVIVFALLIILGMPIAFVIGLSGATHVFTLGNLGFFSVYIERLFNGVASSSYLCIPFFVLAGELLSSGGITKRLLDFVRELVGFVRGGLAYAMVIVAACLSAILGSTSAVVSILCGTITPELVKDGYDDDFAVCLSAAGGILGPIIPPGTTMVLLAVATQTSVRSVFFSGIMPGLLIAFCYAVVIFIKSKRRNYPKVREKFNMKAMLRALWKAGLALLVPFIIIFGVIGGIFSPAEAGAAAVAISLLCGLVYRTLTKEAFWKAIMRTVTTSAGILIIVSFGNVLGWSFAIDQIPAKLSAFVLSTTHNPTLVLAIIVMIMFVAGFFIEGYSAVLIFGPVFGAIAQAVGINMVHYCILFIVIVNIGLLTPPVGMALFVASDISGLPLTKVSKSIVPFVAASLIATVLLLFIPQICLWIPNLLMGI